MMSAKKSPEELSRLLGVIDHEWGTIGPRFLEANEAVATAAGSAHALCVFSASAALEVILRAKNVGRGDGVIVAAWSDPVDSMTCAVVGAVPEFADVDPETFTLTPETAKAALTPRTRALIADLPGGNPCDAAALSEFCRAHGLLFVVNAADSWGASLNSERVWKYADAAFFDLGAGTLTDVGLAGAAVTDSDELFELLYAYHNCGRPQGDGATLSFDSIMGGDLRIAEWQASLIPGRLSQLPKLLSDRARAAGEPVKLVRGGAASRGGRLIFGDEKALGAAGMNVKKCYPLMSAEPCWSDPYFIKSTGADPEEFKKSFPASERAALAALLCCEE